MKITIETSDEEIVSEVKKGKKEFYAYIVDRYEKKLLRYANYLIHDEEKSSDVVQNSFIKAYINLNGFNTNKKFSSWIYRITHNEALNLIKKNYKEIHFKENFEFEDNVNLEEEFDKKEIIKAVNKCINKMPVIYSEVIILYYIDEKSYEEISDILRIPIGTVGTRINRGKGMMKKICKI